MPDPRGPINAHPRPSALPPSTGLMHVTAQLKHTDDGGDLSVFISGDLVLFACNRGHAWTAPLSIERGVGPTRHVDTDVTETEDELEDISVEHERYAELLHRFGPDLPQALGLD